MKLSRQKNEKKSVFDVRASKTTHHRWMSFFKNLLYGKNLVNLRRSFKMRHPWVVSAIVILFAGLIFWGFRQISTRAEAQDFFPTTCLGNWQNPGNAVGQPETMMADAGVPFSSENSAMPNGTSSEIFCGGFVPPDTTTSSDIVDVGLTLVWQIGDAPTSSETSTIDAASATTTAVDEIAPASTTPIEVATTTVTTSTSVMPVATTSNAIATTTMVLQTTTAAMVATTSAPAVSSSDSSDDSFENNPSSSALTSSSTSLLDGSRLFSFFISRAFAQDDETSTAVASDTGATGAGIIATGTISSDTDGEVASVVPIAPPPDQDFLLVSYTTDGKDWIDLATVNTANWPNFTVAIPVSQWSDVENLQVRVEQIPTTQDPVPPVYLDGMFIEVHDEVPSQTPAIASTTVNQALPPAAPSIPPPIDVYDQGAKQTCSISPFSQTVFPGETASATITLDASYFNAPYELFTGNLPSGMSASFADPSGVGSATTTIFFQVPMNAESGSFNMVVIYQEQELGDDTMRNFCQLNLVVK